MGKPGVLITTASQYGANTMEVTKAVEKALAELKPVFESEGVHYLPALHRPATFIEHAIANMKWSLVLGAVLVAIVLFLFLLDLRTAFISFLAIPLSLLTAVIVLDYFGATLNTMTLGGLAVAIGVVVDDAIIDVEIFYAGSGESRAVQPRPLLQVVLDASLEVRSAIVYASFIVALVFLPVLTMTGLQGRFFAPLATAFILAILASLAVALTVTPALCLPDAFADQTASRSRIPRARQGDPSPDTGTGQCHPASHHRDRSGPVHCRCCRVAISRRRISARIPRRTFRGAGVDGSRNLPGRDAAARRLHLAGTAQESKYSNGRTTGGPCGVG